MFTTSSLLIGSVVSALSLNRAMMYSLTISKCNNLLNYISFLYVCTYSARMAGLKGLQGMLSKAASGSGLQVI